MDISSIALQGLEQAQARFDTSARQLASVGSRSGTTTDIADLSAESVSLLTSKNAYEASLNVLKIADNMQKSLVDLIG